MKKLPKPPSPVEPKTLHERAKEEMDPWVRTLSHRERGKLRMDRSSWGRYGGSIIALGTRQGKTARKNKKLKREREAHFKAEKARLRGSARPSGSNRQKDVELTRSKLYIASPPTAPHLGIMTEGNSPNVIGIKGPQ